MSLFRKNSQPGLSASMQQLQLQQLMQYAQQLESALGAVGVPTLGASSAGNVYGPAGALARSGLGNVKAVAPRILPEETVVTVITGWRRWTVKAFDDIILSNTGTAWEPYKALKAEHFGGGNCVGLCTCGIYAYKTREQAETGENARTAVDQIIGEVALWGRVIEHEYGYRAQFAYPRSFLNTGGIAQKLAHVYGVRLIMEEAK